MEQGLEWLRGPVLGLVFTVMLLSGVLITAAFAALVAQMSLLLRMRWLEDAARTRAQAGTGKGPGPAEERGEPEPGAPAD